MSTLSLILLGIVLAAPYLILGAMVAVTITKKRTHPADILENQLLPMSKRLELFALLKDDLVEDPDYVFNPNKAGTIPECWNMRKPLTTEVHS